MYTQRLEHPETQIFSSGPQGYPAPFKAAGSMGKNAINFPQLSPAVFAFLNRE